MRKYFLLVLIVFIVFMNLISYANSNESKISLNYKENNLYLLESINGNPFEITNNNSDSIMKCSEYYNKLISEGWKVVEQDETDAILEKDGIRKHVYLLADTHTYKIDNVVTQAYKGVSSSADFDSISTEFSSSDYQKIKVDDNSYASVSTTVNYPLMRFDVSVQENIDDISQVDILVRGYGRYGTRYIYYFYVKESGSWNLKGSHSYSYKSTLSTTYTSGFNNIITGGILKYGVRTRAGSAFIRTYYGQVVVTYTTCTSNGGSCSVDGDCCSGNCQSDYDTGSFCCDATQCAHDGTCYNSGQESGSYKCDSGTWKKKNGVSCSADSDCYGGYCCHGICQNIPCQIGKIWKSGNPFKPTGVHADERLCLIECLAAGYSGGYVWKDECVCHKSSVMTDNVSVFPTFGYDTNTFTFNATVNSSLSENVTAKLWINDTATQNTSVSNLGTASIQNSSMSAGPHDFYFVSDALDYSSWNYRRDIRITEESGSSLTDYQVPVTFNYNNFNYSHLASQDGDDIRFAWYNSSSHQQQDLDYWIECMDCNYPTTDGLVGWWTMDGNTGTTAYDSSGNGNDGTLYNGPTWTTGKYGSALEFDRANSEYVNIPDADSLDGIKTYEAWIKPLAEQTSSTYYHIIVSKDDSYRHGIYIDYNRTPNRFYIFFENSTGSYSYKYYSIPDYNAWYHVVGVFEDGRAKLYVNGEFIGEGNVINNADGYGTGHSDSPVRIGGGINNRYTTAIIDEARVYNRALTEDEIKQNYKNSKIWFKMPSLPANSTESVTMYYGNSGASAKSNGTNVFEFFDDFSGTNLDTSKWTVDCLGSTTCSINVTDGYAYPSDYGSYTSWHGPRMKADLTENITNYYWTWRFYLAHPGSDLGDMAVYLVNDTGSYQQDVYHKDNHASSSEISIYIYDTGTTKYSECTLEGQQCFGDGWHTWIVTRNGNNLNATLDGTVKYNGIVSTGEASGIWTYFRKYSTYADLGWKIDYIRVQKYASPEPSVGFGSEVSNTVNLDNWWNRSYHYRLPIRVNTDRFDVDNPVFDESINFYDLLDEAGESYTNIDWNSVRVVDESGTEYNSSVELDKEGAVGIWRFEEGDNATAEDSSIYDNDGTVYGNTHLLMHFDEGTGNPQDESPYNNDGTNNGATWQTSGCVSGKCLSFDGSNDYVDCGNDTSLNNIDSSFTIELWFKYRGEGTSGKVYWTLISKNPTGYGYNDPYNLWVTNSSRYFEARVGNGSTQYILSSNTAVDDNQFHHGVLVFDDEANQYYLYLDGIKKANQTVSSDWVPTSNNGNLIIGKWPAYGNFFNGTIDEVAIYSKALSATEIQEHYNVSRAKFTDWTTGKYGSALEFDGVDDYVNISSDLGDPSEMTIEFWFKKPNINQGAQYFLDGRSGGNWWFLQDYVPATGRCSVDSNGNICFDNRVMIGSGNLTNNQWYHVAVTETASETKIYLNGELMDTGAGEDPDIGAGMKIGTRYTLSSYFNGTIDEVRIYPRALTEDEIKAHYESGPAHHLSFEWNGSHSANTEKTFYVYFDTTDKDNKTAPAYNSYDSSLVFRADFDEGGGQKIEDKSEYNNHGTLGMSDSNTTGDPTWTTDCISGYCLDFEESIGEYVIIPDSDILDLDTEITMEAWVKPESFTNDHATICTKQLSYYFNVPTNGTFSVYTYWNNSGVKGYSHYTYSNTVMETGKWYFLAWTENASGYRRLYVNGELDKEDSAEAGIWKDIGNLSIGRYNPTHTRKFDGIIDSVRIYNRALSADEIKAHYRESYLAHVQQPMQNYAYSTGPNVSLDTPPTVTFNSPGNNTYISTNWVLLNVTVVDNQENSINATFYGDGGLLTTYTNQLNGSTVSYNWSSLSNGQHNWTVQATDGYNNNTAEYYYFTTDTINPDIYFVSPTDNDTQCIGRSWSYVNVTINDTNNVSGHIDFDNSLVGWWRFEGNYNDSSTYGNDGSCSNCPELVYGKRGKAYEFDGVDDYVEVPDSASLNITNAITLEAWIKINNFSSDTTAIIDKTSAYRFELTKEGWLQFFIWNGTAKGIGYYTPLSKDNWYHIVATYDSNVGSNNIIIYVNGEQKAYDTKTGTIDINTNEVIIGKLASYYFNGTIDEVRIWNRALSPEEINASYNAGLYRLEHNFTSLAEGDYSLTAYAIDAAGNLNSTETRTISVDTTAPTTTDDSDTACHGSDQTITLTPSDTGCAGTSSTTYCVDTAGTCNPSTSGTSVSVTCSAGSYCEKYVRYRSEDNVGNIESVKTSNLVKIDKAGPNAPTGLSPPDSNVTNDATPSFSWSAPNDVGCNGTVTEYNWTLYSDASCSNIVQTNLTSGTGITASELSDGVYYWRVRAKDGFNNWGAWSGCTKLDVDLLSPSISQVWPNTTVVDYKKTGALLVVNFTFTERNPKNYTIKLFNATDTVCEVSKTSGISGGSDIQESNSCTVGSSSGAKWFNLSVTMYDIFGRVIKNTQTDAVMIDNIPPSQVSIDIGAIVVGGKKYARGVIQLNASATDADSGIDYIEFYANNTLINTSYSAPYSVSWNTSDYSDGLYNVTAKAYDKAGNSLQSD